MSDTANGEDKPPGDRCVCEHDAAHHMSRFRIVDLGMDSKGTRYAAHLVGCSLCSCPRWAPAYFGSQQDDPHGLHDHENGWTRDDHDRLHPACAVQYGKPYSGRGQA